MSCHPSWLHDQYNQLPMDIEVKRVYSSLEHREADAKQRHPSKKKKKKTNLNKSNLQINNAARVYLNDPKLLPRQQINSLIKTSRNAKDKGSFLFKKLVEELERREIEDSFFKRRRNPEPKQMNIQVQAPPDLVLGQIKVPKTACSELKSRRYNYTSFSKRIEREVSEEKESHENYPNARSLFPIKKQLPLETNICKQSLPNPKPVVNQRFLRYPRSQLGRSYSRNPKSNLKSNNSQSSIGSAESNQIKSKSLARTLKNYVINQKDEMASQLLNLQGWRALPFNSDRYTLKWTYNEVYKDYELLHNRNKHDKVQMYYNHMKSNKLVKKDQFHLLTRGMGGQHVRVSSFIPQTFLLQGEKEQFLLQYNKQSLLILVKKHFNYFESKGAKPQNIDIQSILSDVLSLGSSNPEDNLIQWFEQEDNNGSQTDVTVQFSMLYYILIYACNLWICQEGQDSDPFDSIYSQVCADSTIKALIISFAKAEQPFEHYQQSRSSSPVRRSRASPQPDAISIIGGYIRTTKSFGRPSSRLIEAVYAFHIYFQAKFMDYIANGSLNLWILKPCSGSKGCGIELIDKPQRINQFLDSNQHNKMIQKYIENVWILTPQEATHEQLRRSPILNRKFDIRQWVLMTPTCSYIFSHFYVKLCSKEYDLASRDHQIHLSNYSINKDAFIEEQAASVCSESSLLQIFQLLGKEELFNSMKLDIRTHLASLVKEAMEECSPIPGTFEIVGFDIVIDRDLKPWIIECNMSPACSIRTEWLKEMKKAMTAGALEIVLGPEAFENCVKDSSYKWQKLCDSNAKRAGRESPTKEHLEIVGSGMQAKRSGGRKFHRDFYRKKKAGDS